jgi:hypothetical protein
MPTPPALPSERIAEQCFPIPGVRAGTGRSHCCLAVSAPEDLMAEQTDPNQTVDDAHAPANAVGELLPTAASDLINQGATTPTPSGGSAPPVGPTPPAGATAAGPITPAELGELRKLNFARLLVLDFTKLNPPCRVEDYTFREYLNQGQHPPIKDYCTSCEEHSPPLHQSQSPRHPDYALVTISHGAHSSDFFIACGCCPDDNWKQDRVMFLYQSPGPVCDWHHEVQKGPRSKRPTSQWYWIHRRHHLTSYPHNFKGGRSSGYGDFILSVMGTFKLADVYVTNLVKCGMNDAPRLRGRLQLGGSRGTHRGGPCPSPALTVLPISILIV